MRTLRINSESFKRFAAGRLKKKKRIMQKVSRILKEVETKGDKAVLEYTKKYDQAKLSSKQMRVTESEISAAFQNVNTEFINTLKQVINNLSLFYSKKKSSSWRMKGEDGVILGENIEPIESVGIYVPSGTAPLVSSVYMSVLPATIAGVKNIVIASPPGKDGFISPYILVVASLLKVNQIYKMGGAQAIGALAYGTQTVPRVDKIVGPGNVYVTEAKRQVFGQVDIDMLAGPSEVAVVATVHSNFDYVVAELKAQAEHLDGLAVLITTSKRLKSYVKDKIKTGYVINVSDLKQAASVVNLIAPEHLVVMTKDAQAFLKDTKNAGAVFLGEYTPVAIGDYIAGPSHVLPTGGTARFYSGLSVEDFLKKISIVKYTKRALRGTFPLVKQIAELEGLKEHIKSIEVRLGQREGG